MKRPDYVLLILTIFLTTVISTVGYYAFQMASDWLGSIKKERAEKESAMYESLTPETLERNVDIT